MAKATAVISFSPSSGSSQDFALEQKPWTKRNPAKFADWLKENQLTPGLDNLLTAWEQFKSKCNGDGDLVVTLRVRLQDISTPYALRASYGLISPAAKLVTETRREFLEFELASERSIDFGKITETKWNGTTWGADASIINPPAVTLSGRSVKSAVPVYGVLEVVVVEQLYEHTLTISPRVPTAEQAESEDSIYQELYASTAMLFCLDRITLLDIEMPEDFGTCSGGFGGSVKVDDDEDDPEAKTDYSVTFEVFDYCTGKILPDAVIQVADQVVTPATAVNLESGRYKVRVTAPGYTPSDDDDLSENDEFSLSEG